MLIFGIVSYDECSHERSILAGAGILPEGAPGRFVGTAFLAAVPTFREQLTHITFVKH